MRQGFPPAKKPPPRPPHYLPTKPRRPLQILRAVLLESTGGPAGTQGGGSPGKRAFSFCFFFFQCRHKSGSCQANYAKSPALRKSPAPQKPRIAQKPRAAKAPRRKSPAPRKPRTAQKHRAASKILLRPQEPFFCRFSKNMRFSAFCAQFTVAQKTTVCYNRNIIRGQRPGQCPPCGAAARLPECGARHPKRFAEE